MTGEMLSGESGWIVGFLMGLTAGIALTRWLWINGQKHKRRLKRQQLTGEDE